VRVSASSDGIRHLVGTLSGYDGENAAIKADKEQKSMWVSLTSVTRIQQGYGREPNIVEGVIVGLLVGGIGGAVVGSATYEECVPEGWFDCMFTLDSEGQAAALGGLVGVLLGAGLGAITGAFIKTERWEEVPLDRLRVSFAPKRDGRFALGMTVSF
jgi:hypothetical protein